MKFGWKFEKIIKEQILKNLLKILDKLCKLYKLFYFIINNIKTI